MSKRKNSQVKDQDSKKKQKTYHGQYSLLNKLLCHPDLDQLFYSSLNTTEFLQLLLINKIMENVIHEGLKNVTLTSKQFKNLLQNKRRFPSMKTILVVGIQSVYALDIEITMEQFPVLQKLIFNTHVFITRNFSITCPEFRSLESTKSFIVDAEMKLPLTIERVWIPELKLEPKEFRTLIQNYPNLKELGVSFELVQRRSEILDLTQSKITSLKIDTGIDEISELANVEVKLPSLEKFQVLDLSGLNCSVIGHETTTTTTTVVSDMRWLNLKYIYSLDFLRTTIFPQINFFHVPSSEQKEYSELTTKIFNDAVQRDRKEIEMFQSFDQELVATDAILYCCCCRNIKKISIEQKEKQLVAFIDDISDVKKLEVRIKNSDGIHIIPRAHQLYELHLFENHQANKNVLNVFVQILNNVVAFNNLCISLKTLEDWNKQIVPILKGKHPEFLQVTFNSIEDCESKIFKLVDQLKIVYTRYSDFRAKLHIHLEKYKELGRCINEELPSSNSIYL